MPELDFQVEAAEPQPFAAAPMLLFKVRVAERLAAGKRPTSIRALALNCQLRIEPARRRYSPQEQERLLDLFGTPERWGQTLRPFLWTHASVVAPSFVGATSVDLPVPCSFDFTLAATKYFDALQEGDIPLCFLFSGTIFYEADDGHLQIAQVPWDRDAYFRLPAADWKKLADAYYPDVAWLCLGREVFDRLLQYKSQHALPTWDQTLESLLPAATTKGEPVCP
jgi:hypothetical protein